MLTLSGKENIVPALDALLCRDLDLPRLKVLHLDHFNCTPDVLTKTMKRISETLEEISFERPMLLDKSRSTRHSSWEMVVRELAPLLRLKKVNFGLLEDGAISETLFSQANMIPMLQHRKSRKYGHGDLRN